jgi:nucleotide-binding universal stress UspA family protein
VYETVIWATDGSDGAEAALEEALRLVGLSGGRLIAVHCDHRLNDRPGGWSGRVEDDPRSRICNTIDELHDDGCEVELVVRRSRREAADTVAEAAAELDADLIVCGTRGLGAFSGAFLGSFTQRLLHIAPCPVLAVGPRAEVITHPAAARTSVRLPSASTAGARRRSSVPVSKR